MRVASQLRHPELDIVIRHNEHVDQQFLSVKIPQATEPREISGDLRWPAEVFDMPSYSLLLPI